MAVAPVFEERLRERLPLRAEKVLRRIREAHGGKLYDSSWGLRGRGEGPYADAIVALFESTARRLGLRSRVMSAGPADEETPTTFRRPGGVGQLDLFG